MWEWILAGDHSRVVGCHSGCRLCRSIGAVRPLGAAVAGCGRRWLGGSFVGGMVVFVGGRFVGGRRHHITGHVLAWLVTWLATHCRRRGWWL